MKRIKKLLVIFFLCCGGVVFAQSYQIGDVYTAPDGSRGIVYYLHPDGSGGWVVALNDASTGCAWGAATDVPGLANQNPSYYQQLLNDTAGYANTQALRNYQNNSTTYAAGKVDFAHGWVLPSPTQLSMLYGQLPFIASSITGAGGTALAYDWYWCSGERDASNAWRITFGVAVNSGNFNYAEKNTSCRVRAVRSFSNMAVVYDTSLTYQWNTGSTQPYINVSPSQTTTYTVTGTTEFGCSNTAEQTIIVGTGAAQTIYDTVCQGAGYEANGFTITEAETGTAGTLTRSRTLTTAGCSSNLTLQLMVKSPVAELVEATGCGSYIWNGVTYYESGSYTQTFIAANGCDSVVTLHLTLNSPTHQSLAITACESYTWTSGNGQTYTTSGDYTYAHTDANGCTQVDTLHLTVGYSNYIIDGATSSLFSVSADDLVCFSRGNLQYRASTGTWRFAEHQYDYAGYGNNHISSSYSGWIDLFGWGTSGWNSGAAAYQPYATNTNSSSYYPCGSYTSDLAGACAEADWAYHNPISNGGNAVHLWRTLSRSEWHYLMDVRATTSNIGTANARYAKGKVNNVSGVIIFPDVYNHPQGITLPVGVNETGNTGWNGNNYSLAAWESMENAGAVFLPTAFRRLASSIFAEDGGYWSSTHENETMAYTLYFTSDLMFSTNNAMRRAGYAVRPVHDINPSDTTASACYSFNWHGNVYTESGNYTVTLTNSSGCDSVVTLHLTINSPVHQSLSVTTSETYTWTSGNGQTYTTSGDYTYAHADANGCTQVDTLHLTLLSPLQVTVTVSNDTLCEGEQVTLQAESDYEVSVPMYPFPSVLVGDILCTDNSIVKPSQWPVAGKTAKGIVFYVDNTGEHGWAVHLQDQSTSVAWGGYGTDITTLTNYANSRSAITDLNGYSNTQRARAAGTAATYPAAYLADFANGWYLPAAGQLRVLFSELLTVNASLQTVGGTQFPMTSNWGYWSSTERNQSFMWYVTNTGIVTYNLKDYTARVRVIRAF